MNYNHYLKEKVKLLKLAGAEVFDFKINKGISPDKLARVEQAAQIKIPVELIEFYGTVNGCSLNWQLEVDGEPLYGFWDLWPAEKVFFGPSGRLNQKNAQNVFEDILWNDFFEEDQICELKKHKVIESIEGESAYVTLKPEGGKFNLFYVNEGEYNKISLGFRDYLAFVFETYGISNIREEMQKKSFLQNPLKNRSLKLLSKHVSVNLQTTNVKSQKK